MISLAKALDGQPWNVVREFVVKYEPFTGLYELNDGSYVKSKPVEVGGRVRIQVKFISNGMKVDVANYNESTLRRNTSNHNL